MSCRSLSSPGVQLPTGTERSRPHPWRHQPGGQDPRCCPLWEAEARWYPEWVLLSEELAISQYHQWRDRPYHHLPLQGVWQVGALEPGTKAEVKMNDGSVGAVSSADSQDPAWIPPRGLQIDLLTPCIHAHSRHH